MNKKQRLAEGILFTDQYQLTMAQLYFRYGLHETLAQFDHFFRRYPDYGSHQAGYCVNAGLEWLVEWIQNVKVGDEEIDRMRHMNDNAGNPLFAEDFLNWFRTEATFNGLDLRAIPEGRLVHPHVPLTIVEGPLAMAQILETSLLNYLNYQTLIATKAARMVDSSLGRPILEFGLRRGHERGANAGSRAALIGGASFSSNAGISHVLGLPPKGTHAHSLVQLFMALGEGELGAFRAYADVYPTDCLLLVDTVDTLESGVPNAISVFEELQRQGHKPVGIRLDSGDLAHLAIQAAKMLNEAGFADVSIVLSGDLDELVIWQILTQIREEAPQAGLDVDHLINRLVYGVGTRLITSWGEPALGGVYKIVAVQHQNQWRSAIKISNTPAKTPNPGQKEAYRIYDERGKATADLICLQEEVLTIDNEQTLRHPINQHMQRTLPSGSMSKIEPLLVPILNQGKLVYHSPSLDEIRELRQMDMANHDPGVRRLVNPHTYHVSLTPKLWKMKQELIRNAKARLP
ncbi:nicotinate phosphoribosyltransferase [Chloroflexi bacterium TSY]|nr:nicotinate phosphoribosyltransferase [Chloroflexi bacterium TSY]